MKYAIKDQGSFCGAPDADGIVWYPENIDNAHLYDTLADAARAVAADALASDVASDAIEIVGVEEVVHAGGVEYILGNIGEPEPEGVTARDFIVGEGGTYLNRFAPFHVSEWHWTNKIEEACGVSTIREAVRGLLSSIGDREAEAWINFEIRVRYTIVALAFTTRVEIAL